MYCRLPVPSLNERTCRTWARGHFGWSSMHSCIRKSRKWQLASWPNLSFQRPVDLQMQSLFHFLISWRCQKRWGLYRNITLIHYFVHVGTSIIAGLMSYNAETTPFNCSDCHPRSFSSIARARMSAQCLRLITASSAVKLWKWKCILLQTANILHTYC